MTEQEWLASTDPQAMLEWYTRAKRSMEQQHAISFDCYMGHVSDRKLRLFACACCRQVWHMLTDERSRNAVEVAERFADGAATADELIDAHHAAADANTSCWEVQGEDDLSVEFQASVLPIYASASGSMFVRRLHEIVINPMQQPQLAGDASTQSSLLRDIVGNPFRHYGDWSPEPNFAKEHGLERLPPKWLQPILSWRDGTIRKVAQAIYQDRTWDDMPILADALEEAECDNEDVLRHCRGMEVCPNCSGKGTVLVPSDPDQRPWRTEVEMCLHCGGTYDPHESPGTGWIPARGPHVRGCWVLDLLTGRE